MSEVIDTQWVVLDDTAHVALVAQGYTERSRGSRRGVVYVLMVRNSEVEPDTNTYRIVRFHMHAPREVIDSGLTLEEVQAHCQRDDSHGDGWFDGYEVES